MEAGVSDPRDGRDMRGSTAESHNFFHGERSQLRPSRAEGVPKGVAHGKMPPGRKFRRLRSHTTNSTISTGELSGESTSSLDVFARHVGYEKDRRPFEYCSTFRRELHRAVRLHKALVQDKEEKARRDMLKARLQAWENSHMSRPGCVYHDARLEKSDSLAGECERLRGHIQLGEDLIERQGKVLSLLREIEVLREQSRTLQSRPQGAAERSMRDQRAIRCLRRQKLHLYHELLTLFQMYEDLRAKEVKGDDEEEEERHGHGLVDVNLNTLKPAVQDSQRFEESELEDSETDEIEWEEEEEQEEDDGGDADDEGEADDYIQPPFNSSQAVRCVRGCGKHQRRQDHHDRKPCKRGRADVHHGVSEYEDRKPPHPPPVPQAAAGGVEGVNAKGKSPSCSGAAAMGDPNVPNEEQKEGPVMCKTPI